MSSKNVIDSTSNLLELVRVLNPTNQGESLGQLEAIINTFCKPEGWDLTILEERLGFSKEYYRPKKGNQKRTFPPVVRFVRLFNRIKAIGNQVSFHIGLGNTPQDPQTSRVVVH